MSGKKQHIIPQFLQRKFSKNSKQLFVYKKGGMYTVNIKDNYSENKYYSEENGELDNNITVDEQKYSDFLNRLLQQNVNQLYPLEIEFNQFLIHFFFRNKFIYDNIESSAEKLIKEYLIEYKRQAISYFKKNKTIFNKKRITYEVYYKKLHKLLIKIEKQFLQDIKDTGRKLFHNLSINIDKILFSNNHFSYTIIEKKDLILSDITFLVYSENESSYIPFIDNKISHILFPISHNKLLIIHKNDYDISNLFNLNVNDIFISSSWESFSSPEINDSFDILVNTIHSNHFYVQMDDIINSCINEYSFDTHFKEVFNNIIK